MSTKLVRIKPLNPKLGHKVRTYTAGGYKFKEEAGWYKVDADFADKLVELRVDDGDYTSALIFDVMEQDVAQRIEAQEKAAREKASASAPARMPSSSHTEKRRTVQGVMTSADLVAPKSEPTAVGAEPAAVATDDDWSDDLAAEATDTVVAEPTPVPVVSEPAPTRLGPPSRLSKPTRG